MFSGLKGPASSELCPFSGCAQLKYWSMGVGWGGLSTGCSTKSAGFQPVGVSWTLEW